MSANLKNYWWLVFEKIFPSIFFLLAISLLISIPLTFRSGYEGKNIFETRYVTPKSELRIDVDSAAKLEEIKKHFKIEPKLDGELSKDYRELIFTPQQPLKIGSRYKLTISPGINLGNGVMTRDSYEYIFEVVPESSIYLVDRQNESFYTLDAYNRQNIITFVNLYDVKTLKIELFKSTLENFLSHYHSQRVNLPNLRLINKWDLDCEDKDSVSIKLPLDQDGLFLIKVTDDQEKSSSFHYLVTPYALLSRRAENRWAQSAVDTKDGIPLSGMTLRYYLLEEKKPPELLKENITDANGHVQSEISGEKVPNMIVGELKGKLAVNDIARRMWGEGEEGKTTYQIYLYTDRPLYKPGDKVNFKGIVRLDDDVRYAIPAGKEINLKVQGDWNTPPIYENKFRCNDEGIFFGSFKLNDELKTGDYNLYARIGDRSEGWAHILVEKYVKPEFELKLECPVDAVVQGDRIKAKISAKYFFGSPVINQPVKYRLLERDIYYWDWYGEEELESGEIKSGEVILDKNGEAFLEVGTPERGKPKQIIIEVSLADESGRPSYAQKIVTALNSDVDLRANLDEYWGRVGKPRRITITAQDINKKPVEGMKISATLYSDWSWHRKETKLKVYNLSTNSQGLAQLIFKPNESGDYRFVIAGKDRRGRVIQQQLYLWVWGRAQRPDREEAKVSLYANKKEYKTGETARILASLPVEKGVILATISRGKLYRSWSQSFSDFKASFDIQKTEGFMPNMFVQVDVFTAGGFISAEQKLNVPAISKKIKLEIIPDSFKNTPGSKVGITLKTKDYKNRPVSSNASLAVVDKALFALQSDQSRNLFDAFYHERGNQIQAFSSLDNPIAYGAEKGGCFLRGTKIVMADGGVVNIEDVRVGEYVLTRTIEKTDELISAMVTKKVKHVVDEYLIINQQLKVTPAHIIFVEGKWKEAWKIKIGDQLLNVNSKLVEVKQIEPRREKVEVYNLTIKDLQTFFADGFYVHNQKGEEMPARKNFVDVAYWNPNIKTDRNGTAKVNIKMPDNLTTWVAHVKAVTKDTKVGQGETEVLVTKPLFIRPMLPRFVRNGDRVELKAAVHNYTLRPQKVSVGLKTEGLKLLSPSNRQIILRPEDVKTLTWNVSVPAKSLAKLIFSVKSSEYNDKVVLKLPIKPFGEKIESWQSGMAPGELNFKKTTGAMPQFSQYVLSLFPSAASGFPKMLESLIGYPYGCTEQTMSKLYPTALVYRYQKELGIKPPKDIKEMIEKGLTRLAGYQHSDGGWGWWVDDNTNLQMTGYVVEGLLNIRKAKLPVFDAMFNQGLEFLEKSATDESDPDLNAYVLFVLSEAGKAKPELARKLLDNRKLGIQGSCYIALALNAGGLKQEALAILQKIKKMGKKGYRGHYWEDDRYDHGYFLHSQGLASSAVLKTFVRVSPKDEMISGIVQNLVLGEDHYITYDTAVKFSSLTEYLISSGELSPDYDYEVILNSASLIKGHVGKNNLGEKVMVLPHKKLRDANFIRIKKNGKGNLFYSFKQKEYMGAEALKAKGGKIKISREYKKLKGEKGEKLNAGDILKVTIHIKSDESIRYMMVEDHLPAGLEAVNMRLKNEAKDIEDQNYYYEYYNWDEKDMRDDRVVTFITYLDKGERKISYLLRAVTPGVTRAAAAEIQSMYFPGYDARSDSQLIEIR